MPRYLLLENYERLSTIIIIEVFKNVIFIKILSKRRIIPFLYDSLIFLLLLYRTEKQEKREEFFYVCTSLNNESTTVTGCG